MLPLDLMAPLRQLINHQSSLVTVNSTLKVVVEKKMKKDKGK
jgi:hypothetical protein